MAKEAKETIVYPGTMVQTELISKRTSQRKSHDEKAPPEMVDLVEDAAGMSALVPLGPAPEAAKLDAAIESLNQTPLFWTTAIAHLHDGTFLLVLSSVPLFRYCP